MKAFLTTLLLLLATAGGQAATYTNVPLPCVADVDYPAQARVAVLQVQLANDATGIPPFLVGMLLSVPGAVLIWYLTDEHVATRQAIWGAAVGTVIIGAVVFVILNKSNAE